MKIVIAVVGVVLIFAVVVFAAFRTTSKSVYSGATSVPGRANINDIVVKDIDGNDVKLSDYSGKVLLIVNVASKCGLTPQYEKLEALYKQYKEQGLVVLGFPCNDFAGQEPGTNEEIKNFCSMEYGVTFPMFDKIKVLGEQKAPLYAKLLSNPDTGSQDIKWNFEKFLISKSGDVVGRFGSRVQPDAEEVVKAIEAEIKN